MYIDEHRGEAGLKDRRYGAVGSSFESADMGTTAHVIARTYFPRHAILLVPRPTLVVFSETRLIVLELVHLSSR